MSGAAPARRGLFARWQALGLSWQIVIGLVLGVGVGVFFGEAVTPLQPVADTYIRLMQMTVLPYLILTLIAGLGGMDPAQARRLAWRAGIALLVMWALTLLVIAAMPLAFPTVQHASFFSTSLVEARAPLALHELYVPANPFHAMANTVVPAVVLFCAALGVALIAVPRKAVLLDALLVMEQAVVRVTRFVIALTPLGVFAIAAVTAGTLDLDSLKRLEVYFVVFAVASLLLAFVLLPLAVAAVTPFRYREVAGAARDALLTAFVANSAFIVLPLLAERAKTLMERYALRSERTDATIEVVVPLAFTFPNAGKLLTLLFVPFAAWLAGIPLAAGEYAAVLGAGVPAYFAKAQVALPFLLDLAGIPQDQFQLYIPTTVLTGKFDSMVSAMSLFAFSLAVAAAVAGAVEWRAARIARAALSASVALVLGVLLAQWSLAALVDTGYHKDEVLKHMHATRSDTPALLNLAPESLEPAPPGRETLTLERIRTRGSLRVGFDPDNLPFSFFNGRGELVGHDVELAQSLAAALGVRAEFVPVAWRDVQLALREGRIDLMPGVFYRPYWFATLRLSQPYLRGHVGLAMLDERRHDFGKAADLRAARGLRIGVLLDAAQMQPSIRQYFGGSDAKFVPIESARDFFEGRHADLDALLMPAEHAAAYTLLHPRYSLVVPHPDPVKMPIGFAAAYGADDLIAAVDEWIVYADSDGSLRRAYAYWILGQGATSPGRRWSVWHDVLKRGH